MCTLLYLTQKKTWELRAKHFMHGTTLATKWRTQNIFCSLWEKQNISQNLSVSAKENGGGCGWDKGLRRRGRRWSRNTWWRCARFGLDSCVPRASGTRCDHCVRSKRKWEKKERVSNKTKRNEQITRNRDVQTQKHKCSAINHETIKIRLVTVVASKRKFSPSGVSRVREPYVLHWC